MRIRMPKSILTNIGAEKGITKFAIYFDKANKSIVLKAENEQENSKSEL